MRDVEAKTDKTGRRARQDAEEDGHGDRSSKIKRVSGGHWMGWGCAELTVLDSIVPLPSYALPFPFA
jgi:hypothetical protein